MSSLSSISVDDLANLYRAPSTTPRRSILPPVLPTQADAPRQEAQQPNDAGARDPAQGRTWGELGSDLWTGLQQGVQGIASGINNLGDLASGGLLSYGMGHLYSAATGTEERPTMQEIGQRVSQNLSAQESPYLQAQRQQLQADMAAAGQQGGIAGGLEKAWAAAKGTATNPALLGQMAIEQVPILAAMGTGSLAAAGRAGETARLAGGTPAMIRQAAEQAAIRANIGLSGGLGAGYSSQQAAEEVLNAPAEELAKSPNYQALVQSGLSDRQARQQLAQQAMVPAAAIAGPVSALTARITAPMETAAFMGKLPKGFGPVAAAGVREMTEEIPQESSEQIGQNVGARSVGLNRDIMAGVPEAAGQAGVAGLLMGAGLGGVNVARHGSTGPTRPGQPEFQPPAVEPGAETSPLSPDLAAPPAGLNEPLPDTGPVSRAANQVISRSAPPPLAAGRNAPFADPYAEWVAGQQPTGEPSIGQQSTETIPRQADAGNPRPEVREGSRVGSPVEPVTDQNPAPPLPEVTRAPQSQEALPAEAEAKATLNEGQPSTLGGIAPPRKNSRAGYLDFSSASVPHPLSGYLGNKKTMLDAGAYDGILPDSARFNRVIEPFGGSGLLGNALNAKLRAARTLNDLDPHISNFHAQVQQAPDAVVGHVRRMLGEIDSLRGPDIPLNGETSKSVISWWKQQIAQRDRAETDGPAKAAWTLIQNNGSISVMGKGQRIIKTEKGVPRWNVAPDLAGKMEAQIRGHHDALKTVTLTRLDAREILARAGKGDLVPVDPPYVAETGKKSVADYDVGKDLTTIPGAVDFILTDVKGAVERGAQVIYTNYARPEIVEALRRAGLKTRIVNRRSQRGTKSEVVGFVDHYPADQNAGRGTDPGRGSGQNESSIGVSGHLPDRGGSRPVASGDAAAAEMDRGERAAGVLGAVREGLDHTRASISDGRSSDPSATVRTLAARPEVQALGDRIAVVGRQSELRPELQPKDGGPVKAVIDGNRIVLVGEHWTAEDLANLDGVLQHEAGVHLARDSGFYDPKVQAAGKVLRAVGLKGLAGEASWADVTRQLESLRHNGNESVAKAVAMAEQAGTSPELMSEEALGYLAELNPKHSLVRRLVATVKAALYRMGVNVKLDDAALVALARSGLNRVKTEQRLPTDPQEPRYSKLIRWTDNQAPEVRSMAEKIGAEPKPWTERLAEMRRTLPTRIRQGTIDRFARLLDLDRARFGRDVIDTDTALSSWVAAKMSKSPEGALEGAFLHGRLKWDDGALNVQETKQGLAKALEPIASAGELNRFWQWIIAHRSNRLMSEGRERLFTPQEIAAGMRLNEGKMQGGRVRDDVYRKAFARYVEIQKSVLDVAEQAGLFSAAQRAQWEHDFYLPYYRVIDNKGELRGPSNGGGKLIRQKAFEKLKGGTEKLGDPLQNILRNWHHLIDASLKNRAASLALDTAETLGIAKVIPSTQSDKNSVWVMRNGDKVHYRVDDPLTLEALSALNAPMMSGAAVKALAGFKRALTIGVTISPAFKARNLLRDSVAAFAISGLSPNVFKVNPIKGMMLAREGSATQAALLTGGGTFRFGTMMEGDPAAATRRIAGWKPDTVLSSAQQIKGFYQTLKSGLDAWNRLGDQMETANRASIYEQMRSEGKTHLQASLAARDLMDFSQSGAWPAVRFLTTITPFLNARLQGMDVLYRKGFNPLSRTVTGKASSGERKTALRFAATIATVSLASTLLYLAYRDDEDFQKREQWDRDNYWWFKLGEDAYRIPKPFEVGALGTIADRIAEQIVDQSADGKLFADRLKFMLTQTFAMSLPQAVNPVWEISANKSAFTGRPIEPMGMDGLSPELKARYNTSAAAIAASRAGLGKVGLSPLQIEHLVRGYFGWIGAQALLAGDFAARPAMGLPERPMKQSDIPLIGDLLQSFKPDSRGSRYVTEFYEQAKEVRQVMADARLLVKLGDTEALNRLKQDKSKEIGQSASVEAVARMFSAFGEMERMIANDRKMSGLEKQRRIDAIEKQKSDIAREVGRRLR